MLGCLCIWSCCGSQAEMLQLRSLYGWANIHVNKQLNRQVGLCWKVNYCMNEWMGVIHSPRWWAHSVLNLTSHLKQHWHCGSSKREQAGFNSRSLHGKDRECCTACWRNLVFPGDVIGAPVLDSLVFGSDWIPELSVSSLLLQSTIHSSFFGSSPPVFLLERQLHTQP